MKTVSSTSNPGGLRALGWIVLLTLSVGLAYSSALWAPFVFDDVPAIARNETIRTLSPVSAPLTPPANTSVSGRPLVNFSFAINYAINEALGVAQPGPNSTLSYHAGNVLIHVACALLLFAIVRRTLASEWADTDREDSAGTIAGLTALLWALHPIQTEAVDYAVQRTELMVSAFYLTTLYCSMRAWDAKPSRRFAWLAASVLAFLFGTWSKEVILTAPFIVVLYDWTFRAESWRALFADRSRRFFYIALGVVTLLALAFVGGNARTESVGFNLGMTWYEYAYTQFWAITRYLRLLVWPVGLTFDYGDHPIRGVAGIPGLLVIGACFATMVLTWRRPNLRWAAFVGAWFFVILAPSSSIVPIRTEIAAERRVYLASASVILLIVLAIDTLRRRYRLGPSARNLGVGALAAALAVLTFYRGRVYADAEALYRDVIAKAPANARGYVGVGLALTQSGVDRSSEAEALFHQAIQADSTYFAPWQLLGILALSHERWLDARKYFEGALRLQPGNRPATDGLVRSLIGLRDFDAAIPHLNVLGDADVDALWSVSTHLVEQNRGAEAIRYLELVAKRAPSAFTLAMLSAAYAQANRADVAVETARAATSAAGDTVSVYVIAGRAMLIARRFDDARTYLQHALSLDPASTPAKRALEEVRRSASSR
ncbi:MAG TPA: tetratricopeptide repeat protein [Gemmatimonadaceae bacterium]